MIYMYLWLLIVKTEHRVNESDSHRVLVKTMARGHLKKELIAAR